MSSATTTTKSSKFKSKLNSVSNGFSPAALKQHINTCLQRWRQKDLHNPSLNKSRKQPPPRKRTEEEHQSRKKEKCDCQFQPNSFRWFGKHFSHDYSFIQRTSKSFNTKFQNFIFFAHQERANKSYPTPQSNNYKGPLKYGRKVEIVAKLLSTTLIAKAKTSTEEVGQQTDETIYSSFEEQIKVIQSSTTSSTADYNEHAMTITELTFLEIRQEYPDLNSEIRSILTARAQDGATISEIRSDYRKLTGIPFPVYEDITEFLLTIPYVSAFCTEQGTRIFSIRPTDKTKHIHEMVLQQKPQAEPILQRPTNRYYYRERQRNNHYQPTNWRSNVSRRQQYNNVNIYIEPDNIGDLELQDQCLPSTESNLSRESSEGFFENNCYYKDNCNYLNRICNQQPLTVQLNEPDPPQTLLKTAALPAPSNNAVTSSALNNFITDIPSYKNNVNHINNLFHLQQNHPNPFQQNVNNLPAVDNRRTSHNFFKSNIPRSSRSSSPTAKSWYTNDSAFTDSDYEAHLLDFLLLGDDFLLYMARMELRCKFKKNQRILQSGLCVSGQTIGAAIRRISAIGDSRRSIILNIGSVDIMQGRQLIKIEHDFRELLQTMLKKGVKPILTTLAPLANYSHCNEKSMLERFNEFIKREGENKKLIVIDIWKCLVNEKGHVLFDCFQNEPRNVTGTSEPYLFWNKIGRQRVLQLIESKLEY